MSEQMTIRDFLRKFDAGEFNDPSVKVQITAGWNDWFCSNSSLARKTKDLGRRLKRIAGSKLIDQDTMYVWFQNNCPVVGRLYDDIRIADIQTGETIYVIVPKSGYTKYNGRSQVHKVNHDVGFDDPKKVEILVDGSWKDVVEFFKRGGE